MTTRIRTRTAMTAWRTRALTLACVSDGVSSLWQPGTATAIGSYPGTDPDETLRLVLGELPELPHLPELPERGPGADMIGRSAALLVDLAVSVQPSGWRFSDRPGRDWRRARDFLARDLDLLEEHAHGYEGPFKVQVAGPWTLAGAIELRHGDKALADPGAVRDLTASLAEGVTGHLADLTRRLPGATFMVQIDEPGLPGVLAGTVPTASGFGRLPAVEAPLAEEGLRAVVAAAGAFPLVHCCAPDVPYGLLQGAGARAVAMNASLIGRRDDEALGAAVEAGMALFLGVEPVPEAASSARSPRPDREAAAERDGSARRVRELWRWLGFSPASLSSTVVITPSCGLATAAPDRVRPVLDHCRAVARALRDDPGE